MYSVYAHSEATHTHTHRHTLSPTRGHPTTHPPRATLYTSSPVFTLPLSPCPQLHPEEGRPSPSFLSQSEVNVPITFISFSDFTFSISSLFVFNLIFSFFQHPSLSQSVSNVPVTLLSFSYFNVSVTLLSLSQSYSNVSISLLSLSITLHRSDTNRKIPGHWR